MVSTKAECVPDLIYFDLCLSYALGYLCVLYLFCPHRFQVTGLIEGQWYAYRIRAFNKLGASRPCRATDEIQAVDARGRPASGRPLQ